MSGFRKYMHSVLEEHRDPKTYEINATTLAEDCIQHFDIKDESVQEHMFEIAFELSDHDWAENRTLLFCSWRIGE